MSYLHVPSTRFPGALAELHRTLVVGAPVVVQVLAGEYEGDALPADRIGGRFFASWTPPRLTDVLVGAGFDVDAIDETDPGADATPPGRGPGEWLHARARRARTLPDFVGPGMRLLVVGLNPSVYAADAGVGFARPGNRFWPAMHAAGFSDRLLRPCEGRLLLDRGYGITNIADPATATADELSDAELIAGARKLVRKVKRYRPRVVAFLGVTAYRTAFGRPGAAIGRQEERIGESALWVLPNPSGLNAHYQLAGLVPLYAELRRAAEDIRHGGA
jgi:TDG/mug DNA glycosylase family protein